MVRKQIDQLRAAIEEDIDAAMRDPVQVWNRVYAALAVLVVLTIVVAVVILLGVRRSVVRPLKNLVSDVSVVAAGDFAPYVEEPESPELATVARAVNKMRNSLTEHTRSSVTGERMRAKVGESERLGLVLHDTVLMELSSVS